MAGKRSGWDVVAMFLGGFASPGYHQAQQVKRLERDVSFYKALNAGLEARLMLLGVSDGVDRLGLENLGVEDIEALDDKALPSGE